MVPHTGLYTSAFPRHCCGLCRLRQRLWMYLDSVQSLTEGNTGFQQSQRQLGDFWFTYQAENSATVCKSREFASASRMHIDAASHTDPSHAAVLAADAFPSLDLYPSSALAPLLLLTGVSISTASAPADLTVPRQSSSERQGHCSIQACVAAAQDGNIGEGVCGQAVTLGEGGSRSGLYAAMSSAYVLLLSHLFIFISSSMGVTCRVFGTAFLFVMLQLCTD